MFDEEIVKEMTEINLWLQEYDNQIKQYERDERLSQLTTFDWINLTIDLIKGDLTLEDIKNFKTFDEDKNLLDIEASIKVKRLKELQALLVEKNEN